MIQTETAAPRYALDRIEQQIAVLQPLGSSAAASVQVPARLLCADCPAGKRRPADGTVFYCDEAGRWHADLAATAARQQQMQAALQQLLDRSAP